MTRIVAAVAAIWRGLTTRPAVTSRDELSWLDQHDSMRYWDGDPDDPARPWLHDGGLPHATYANAVDRLGQQEADRFNKVVRDANEGHDPFGATS